MPAMRCFLVLFAFVVLAAPAQAEVVPFQLGGARHPKRKVVDLPAKTRKVRISFASTACRTDDSGDGVDHIAVNRHLGAVVITVHLREFSAPYGTVCPALAFIVTREVKLKGRLGTRKLKDGSSDPPRLVAR